MDEQLDLLQVDDSYSLVGLRDSCTLYVKRKYPKPADEESFEEYVQFLKDEADLEFVERLRRMANQIENRVLNPIRKTAKQLYSNLTEEELRGKIE